MRTYYDTSINIEKAILDKLKYLEKKTGYSKQRLIIKFLSYFIKKTKKASFIGKPTILYQQSGGIYRKLTLHLNAKEVELLQQIRVVTHISISYSLFFAMNIFIKKILKKRKKYTWMKKILKNYTKYNNYPEYSILILQFQKNNRHALKPLLL
jgi:hypothetical protein